MSYNQRQMTLNSVVDRAWEVSKRHWGALVGIYFIGAIINSIPSSAIQSEKYFVFLAELAKGNLEGAEAAEAAMANTTPNFAGIIVAYILAIVLSTIVSVVLFKYIHKILADKDISDFTQILKDAIKIAPMAFVKILLYGLVCALGMVFFLLPGIYLAVRLYFVMYISAIHPELTIEETFKKSWKMTDGRFLQLFGYGIVSGLIAMSGLLLCCVGIYFTVPVTYVMMGETYNQILEEMGEDIDDEEPLVAANNEIQ